MEKVYIVTKYEDGIMTIDKVFYDLESARKRADDLAFEKEQELMYKYGGSKIKRFENKIHDSFVRGGRTITITYAYNVCCRVMS